MGFGGDSRHGGNDTLLGPGKKAMVADELAKYLKRSGKRALDREGSCSRGNGKKKKRPTHKGFSLKKDCLLLERKKDRRGKGNCKVLAAESVSQSRKKSKALWWGEDDEDGGERTRSRGDYQPWEKSRWHAGKAQGKELQI